MRIFPVIFLMLALPALAQGTKPLGLPASKPADVEIKPVAKVVAKTNQKPGSAQAVALLDLPTWFSERSAALAIRGRSFDPFGQPKDPSVAPPVPETIDPDLADIPAEDLVEKTIDLKAAFADAVKAIKISIVADDRITLAGGTTLQQGQVFSLASGQIKFKTRVSKVSTSVVVFEDTENGTRAEIPLGSAMPSGMRRGAPSSTDSPFQPNRSTSTSP